MNSAPALIVYRAIMLMPGTPGDPRRERVVAMLYEELETLFSQCDKEVKQEIDTAAVRGLLAAGFSEEEILK